MDTPSLADRFSIRVKTRLYIRPLFGAAISGPSMYAHSDSSKGPWNGETVISADVRFGSLADSLAQFTPTAALGLRLQPVDATHWLNRSAGVLKSNVFLGRSLSCRATALSLF